MVRSVFLFFSIVFFSFCQSVYSQKVYHKILDGQRLFNGRQNTEITAAFNNDGYVVMSKKGHWSYGYSVHLICFDACDQVKWEKEIDVVEGHGIAATDNGYVMLGVGYTTQSMSNYASMLILRLDTMGNILSTFTLEDISVTDPKTLDLRNFGVFEDGSYYVSGQSFDAPNPGNRKLALVKFDKNDDVLWSNYYEANDNLSTHYFESIPTKDGGVLIYTLSTTTNKYVFGHLLKIDPNGAIQWVRKSAQLFGQISKPLEVDDGYIIAANNESNHPDGMCYLVKIDLMGNHLWTSKAFGEEFSQFTLSHLSYANKIIVFGIHRYDNTGIKNSFAIAAEFLENGQLIKAAEYQNLDDGYFIGINTISLFDYYFVLAAPTLDSVKEYYMNLWKGRGIDDLLNCGFTEVSGTFGNVAVSFSDQTIDYRPFNTLKNFAVIEGRNSRLDVTTECDNEAPLPPMVALPNDTIICDGSSFILRNKYNLPKYNWSTGERQPTIKVTEDGQYVLKIDYGCIKMSDTINVNFYPEYMFDFEVNPTDGTMRDTIEFTSLSEKVADLIWEIPGIGEFKDSLLSYRFENDNIYKIKYTITDSNGCVRTGQTYLIIRTPELPVELTYDQIYIPNSFTPDGNGVNESFGPKGELIHSFRLEIFNRWGEHIFDDYNRAWDGGRSPLGSYLYRLTMQLKTGDVLNEKGVVYLMK